MRRLVVPHNTCPSLSPPPPRTQFYNRSCSNKHNTTGKNQLLHAEKSLPIERLGRKPVEIHVTIRNLNGFPAR
jgi:hypothetical protein